MAERLRLSPEQEAVVESWGSGIAVLAGAGAGKTSTLVMKCAALLKRKPDARFAAVSFTEKSASDLKVKLADKIEWEDAAAFSRHWVMTIHGLCAAIIREFPREAGFEGEESVLTEAEAAVLWDRAIDFLWVEELPEEVQGALELLLDRESRGSVEELLRRTRELDHFGLRSYLVESSDSASRALALLSAAVLERYERLKRRRGVLDFNDMERGADRALELQHVRRGYQERFDLVLVDEFQDTNPVQARIIWRFVNPDLSNLCIVGDPKQSIYRFRDADVALFEELCAKLPVRLSLTWNFRSVPGVIDFVNATCEKPFVASGMRYEALVPRLEARAGMDPVVRLELTDPPELATWLTNEIAQGARLEDFALLLRRVRGNERWLKALSAAGIPLAIGSGGLFWEDPRVREMVAFLKWWDNPGNSLSGAVFLRAPWVAVDDRELDDWVFKDRSFVEPFFSSAHPLAAALQLYRGRVVRPGELLLALLGDPACESELGSTLLGLWHRCEELSSRGMDFHSVVIALAKAVEEGQRERDVPPPRNQGQLRVLTIHGSKGLEFKNVILVDLPEKPERAKPAPLLFWDRENGAYLGGRTEDGERDRKNGEEESWRAREKEKALAESKRLFYVALTRAEERLILAYVSLSETEDARPRRESSASAASPYSADYWRGWIEASGAEMKCGPVLARPGLPRPGTLEQKSPSGAARATDCATTSGRPKKTIALHRPRHSVTEWSTLSRCERAYEWKFVRRPDACPEPRDAEPSARLLDAPDGISQKDLGTRVHAALETGDYEALRQIETEAGEARFHAERVIEWAKASPFMTEARADEREVWNELPFELSVGGENLVGSIDRLVCDHVGGKPQYCIVDFKVTQKMKSADELLEAYQAQIQLYALALDALTPEARDQTRGVLVNISGSSVQTVEVPVQGSADLGRSLASRARAIVLGETGQPKSGPLCRVCEFRTSCSAAQTR